MNLGLGLIGGGNKLRLPTTGLIFKMLKPDMIDTIGLSVGDYLSIRYELRSIFFSDATTKRDDTTIIINIQASEYLNNGWELMGSEARGYALYMEITSETILRKAYRYFGVAWPETSDLYWQRVDGTNILRTDGSPIEVF